MLYIILHQIKKKVVVFSSLVCQRFRFSQENFLLSPSTLKTSTGTPQKKKSLTLFDLKYRESANVRFESIKVSYLCVMLEEVRL